MLDVGWLEESVLFVVPASEQDRKNAGNPSLYDVEDGNTCLQAALQVPSITEIPCRIIQLPEGMDV
jgi:hypothetical protein